MKSGILLALTSAVLFGASTPLAKLLLGAGSIRGSGTTEYRDEGYIHGHEAPLNDRMATQKHLDRAEEIYLLRPQRRNGIVPPGVTPVDPFALVRS